MTQISINKYLTDLTTIIDEVSPQDAYAMQKRGAYIVDIRTTSEIMTGFPENALTIPRDHMEFEMSAAFSSETHIILICAAGKRSLLAAKSLHDMGFKKIYSIQGGYENWRCQSLPSSFPKEHLIDYYQHEES